MMLKRSPAGDKDAWDEKPCEDEGGRGLRIRFG